MALVCVALSSHPAGAALPGRNGRIAFVSDRNGSSEIFTMRADGTHQRQITHNAGQDGAPAWQPLPRRRHHHR